MGQYKTSEAHTGIYSKNVTTFLKVVLSFYFTAMYTYLQRTDFEEAIYIHIYSYIAISSYLLHPI